MSPEEIALVRESWQKVLPIQDTAAAIFYARLFELDPALKGLFKGDMAEQQRKLMVTLNTVVTSLDNLAPLIEVVENLGRRHVGYGVKAEHYDTVGIALLWTLGQGLGELFTPSVEGAWTMAYTTLAGVMKQAAYA